MKNRIEFIDLAKGICISLVVLLHVLGDVSGAIIQIMNLFRMPLYFVLSGLFFKTYGGFHPFFMKKTNKLLVPFLFTYFCIIIPTSYILTIRENNIVVWRDLFWSDRGVPNLGVNGASWFLVCLFAVNLFFYLIFLVSRNKLIGIVLLSGMCGLLGFFLNQRGLYLPIWMGSALTATPFFLVGYVFRGYSTILYGEMKKKDFVYGVLSLFVLLLIYGYDEWKGVGVIAYGANVYDISIMSLYCGGVAGTYFVLMISKCLGYLPILSYIGRYSIVVLLTHLPLLFVIRNILYQLDFKQDSIMINMAVFVLIILLELPIIKLCIKYLPYCFAQKELFK
jgi:fucose 4-O-acetylase-like acetyltransferase